MAALTQGRGGWWALGQSVLMLANLALGPLVRGPWGNFAVFVVGWGLCGVGAVVGIAGALALGRNRTIFPRPRADAVLIRSGIYARIRHPLYTSVILLALGWSLLWHSGPALLVAAGLVVCLQAKARREERWLRQKFPEYAEYQRRVPRFLPRFY